MTCCPAHLLNDHKPQALQHGKDKSQSEGKRSDGRGAIAEQRSARRIRGMIPTSTRVAISSAANIAGAVDAVAVFISEKSKAIENGSLAGIELKAAERLISAGVARGKAREVAAELVDGAAKKSRHVMVVGIGRAEKVSSETIRQAAAALAKAARRRRVKNVAVVTPQLEKISLEGTVEAIVSGFLLASFKYEEHKGAATKKNDDEESGEPVRLTIVGS